MSELTPFQIAWLDRNRPGWRDGLTGMLLAPESSQSSPSADPAPAKPVGRPGQETLVGDDGTVHADVPGHGFQPVTTAGLTQLDRTPTGQPRIAPHMLGKLAPPATNAVGIPLTGPTGPLHKRPPGPAIG